MSGLEGVGVYARRLQKKIHGTPKAAAKKLSDHRISFVPIMGAWQQPRKDGVVKVGAPNANDLAAYVEAFAAKGIKVGLWYYPWAGHEEALVEKLRSQSEGLPIEFWLNDAELGYKWKSKHQLARAAAGTNMRGVQPEAIRGVEPKGGKAWMLKRAQQLMALVDEARADGLFKLKGHTAYGVAQFHPNYPWEIFCEDADFLSPQLYTATKKQIDMGIANWYDKVSVPNATLAALAGYMLPSIGTYGPRSGPKMHEHLSSFIDAEEGVDGFIAWSWMQTNSQEWDVLARWADWVSRGACTL